MNTPTGTVVCVVSCGDVPVNKKGVYVEGRIFFRLGDTWVISPRECLVYGVTKYTAPMFHEPRGVIYKAPGQQGYVTTRNGQIFGADDLSVVESWLEKQTAAA